MRKKYTPSPCMQTCNRHNVHVHSCCTRRSLADGNHVACYSFGIYILFEDSELLITTVQSQKLATFEVPNTEMFHFDDTFGTLYFGLALSHTFYSNGGQEYYSFYWVFIHKVWIQGPFYTWQISAQAEILLQLSGLVIFFLLIFKKANFSQGAIGVVK